MAPKSIFPKLSNKGYSKKLKPSIEGLKILLLEGSVIKQGMLGYADWSTYATRHSTVYCIPHLP